MATAQQVKTKAAALRKKLAEIDRLTGGKSDAQRMAEKRAAERDLDIPRIADVARRLACLDDVYEAMRVYFADVFYQPFTESRREMIDAINRAATTSGDQAIAGPRGDGKSRGALFASFWLAIRGISTFPMVLSKSGERARQELKNLKWGITTSKKFAADFPEIAAPIHAIGGWSSKARQQTVYGTPTDMEWFPDHFVLPTISTESLAEHGWNEGVESLARGQIFASLGIEGPVRGYSIRNQRPSLVVIDDIDDRESAKSQLQTESRIEIIDSDVAGLGGPARNVSRVFLCTLINRSCAAYVFTDRKQRPSFHGQRHKLITKFPDRPELGEQYVAMRSGRDIDADPDGDEATRWYTEHQEDVERGYTTSNPYRFGLGELSPLHAFYNWVADKGLPSALTELQNDPPPDDSESRLMLSAYRVRSVCRSGLKRGVVPDDCVKLFVGADIKKAGVHHVTIALNSDFVGSVIDYDFYPFHTEGIKPSACELLIFEGLQEWWALRQASPFCQVDGTAWAPDLTVIDSGWKDEGWNSQPVALFAESVNYLACPSKGIANWRPKKAGPGCLPGDNCNWVTMNGKNTLEVNADHWKIRVHEGFLLDYGVPGSLGLFTPTLDDWGREPSNAHLSYAKEITSERWGPYGPNRTFRWAPADGSRTQKPNHYLDATSLALAARAMRDMNVISLPAAPIISPVEDRRRGGEVESFSETGGGYW